MLYYLHTLQKISFGENLTHLVLMEDPLVIPSDLIVKILIFSERQNIFGWFMVFISNECHITTSKNLIRKFNIIMH